MASEIPARMIFSCDEEAFLIFDAQTTRALLRSGEAEPWLELRCGPGNAMEARPLRVVGQEQTKVSVQCDDDSVVHLDLGEGEIFKEAGGVTYRYRGDLSQGNDGLGYIRLR